MPVAATFDAMKFPEYIFTKNLPMVLESKFLTLLLVFFWGIRAACGSRLALQDTDANWRFPVATG